MDGKITLSVSSLEQQLERKSGNWYGNYEPTSGNNPASAWTTDELRQEHERDLFSILRLVMLINIKKMIVTNMVGQE